MKRTFDVFFVLLLIPAIGMIALIVAAFIKISDGGPVLYWSERVGKNNVIFKMPKFRTMILGTPQLATHLLDGKSYLIPYGAFIRKASLDELPQLWSVLVGEMSLVGPRPALFNQDDLIDLRTQRGVHTLLPGITGWAQINGRDEISLATKVDLDFEYLQQKSFLFDFKIIGLTFFKVLSRNGISH